MWGFILVVVPYEVPVVTMLLLVVFFEYFPETSATPVNNLEPYIIFLQCMTPSVNSADSETTV